MLEIILNHADHFYLFPEAILLTSFYLDRFKVWSLCKYRPECTYVPVCVWSLFPLEFGSNVGRIC
jgi:hypothetical protein